jgi:hypothetical protein
MAPTLVPCDDECHCSTAQKKSYKILLYLLIAVLFLQCIAIALYVGLHERDVQMGIKERKIITEGIFPKLMSALQAALHEPHHTPLQNIVSGLGDVLSGFFSPSVKAIKGPRQADYLSYDLIRDKREALDSDEQQYVCMFDLIKFRQYVDMLDFSNQTGY